MAPSMHYNYCTPFKTLHVYKCVCVCVLLTCWEYRCWVWKRTCSSLVTVARGRVSTSWMASMLTPWGSTWNREVTYIMMDFLSGWAIATSAKEKRYAHELSNDLIDLINLTPRGDICEIIRVLDKCEKQKIPANIPLYLKECCMRTTNFRINTIFF